MKATFLISGLCLVIAFASSVNAAEKKKQNSGESELAKKVLDKFDANRDGQVDQREQAAARMQNGRGPGGGGRGGPGKGGPGGGPNLQELLKQLDTNGNGAVEAEEIQTAKAKWDKRRAEKAEGNKGAGKNPGGDAQDRGAMFFMAMLKKLDSNGNGSIEAQEIQAAQAQLQAAQGQMQAAKAQAARAQSPKRRPGVRGKR